MAKIAKLDDGTAGNVHGTDIHEEEIRVNTANVTGSVVHVTCKCYDI